MESNRGGKHRKQWPWRAHRGKRWQTLTLSTSGPSGEALSGRWYCFGESMMMWVLWILERLQTAAERRGYDHGCMEEALLGTGSKQGGANPFTAPYSGSPLYHCLSAESKNGQLETQKCGSWGAGPSITKPRMKGMSLEWRDSSLINNCK